MNFRILWIALATFSIGATSEAKTTISVLDGPQLCAFYQDANNCYQQAIQIVREYSQTGQFSADKKSCVFPDGSTAVFNTSLKWMLDTYPAPYKPQWDFVMYSAPGRIAYEFKTNGNYEEGFWINGALKSGSSVSVAINRINYSAWSRIAGSIKCEMNAKVGEVEYVITQDALQDAHTLCPSVVPSQEATPGLSTAYSASGYKVNVDAYMRRLSGENFNIFTCRNF